MIVHCQLCDNQEEISTKDLQASYQPSSEISEFFPSGDILPNAGSGIPYAFQELVDLIRESLPAWNCEITKAGNEQSLKLTCPRHLKEEEFIKKFVD